MLLTWTKQCFKIILGSHIAKFSCIVRVKKNTNVQPECLVLSIQVCRVNPEDATVFS